MFIGYPNVGKSAILEAMSALSYLQVSCRTPFSDLCRYKNSSELFFDGNINEEIAISYSNEIKTGFRSKNQQTLDLEIRVTTGSQKVIDNQVVTFESGKILKHLSFSDKHVDDVSGKYIVLPESRSHVYGDLTVKKYEFRNKLNNFKTTASHLDFPFGENLVDIIQFSKKIRREVAELFKHYNLKLSIDLETNAVKGLKQLDDETIFLIPFYQMADTLQRLIFHKAAIMSNENTVLLFEEPEAHMFPPYVSNLMNDIIHDEKNNQFFIATHSPFVLNDLMEDARNELSIYAVGLHNGETTIKRITDEEMHEIYQYGIDLFFNLEDYLKDV